MSTTLAITLLLGMVILACGAMVFLGIFISHLLKKLAPEHRALSSVSPTGIALCACFTSVMVVGVAARELAPESVLGSFLSTERGILTALGFAWFAFTIAATVFHRIGKPIFKVKRGRDA